MMAMTDCDVQKQVNHMIAFIEQEASEKIEEIDAKAEEEFNIEKCRIVLQERLKIMESYTKKEKAIKIKKKIQFMNLMNHARIELLSGRQDLLGSVIEEARSRLVAMTRHNKKYTKILSNLILEGFYQAMEPYVMVRCREKDAVVVNLILPQIMKKYRDTTGMELEAVLDEALYLPPYCSGGCQLIALHGRLKIDNSLDSRLELISQKLAPQIREALFGPNTGRKFRS